MKFPSKNIFWLALLALLAISQVSVSQVPVDPAPSGYELYKSGIPHGVLSSAQYKSKTVGTTRKLKVYTPPGYTKTKKYPVLYLLHGIGGDENEWKYYSNPDFILDNLYAQNKIAPMIVVFPNGRAMVNDQGGGDLFTAEKIKAFETFEFDLINDLIPFIDTTYAVLSGSENRALAGYSMGGGQSMNFGLGHTDKFAWVGGFSYGPNTKSAAQLVPKPADTNAKLKLLYMACGNSDGLLSSNQSIHNYFVAYGVKHTWFVVNGAHETKVWQNDLYNFSQLIFKSTSTASAQSLPTTEPGFFYNQSEKCIQMTSSGVQKCIDIYNIKGQLIKSVNHTDSDKIAVQELKSGVYVAKLTDANKTSSVKFTVQ